jgi:hypothetical protein
MHAWYNDATARFKLERVGMTDLDIANYHEGMSFENACRSYVGMIETGEVNIERVRKLAPKSMVKVVNDYFHPETDISTFRFPTKDRHAEIREIAQKYGASNGWAGTSGMLSKIIVELLDEIGGAI